MHPAKLGEKYRLKVFFFVALSFLLPAALMLLGLIGLRSEPFFDSHNLAICDGGTYLFNQAFFGRLLKGQENWLYSFKNGLGGNEWSALAWGQISIGALLSAFAVPETIPTIFSWISVVNMALCGLTMYLLLAELFGHRGSNLIFSTSYALMGFNVVNCYIYLFFQGPQFLPLVVLGLFRMRKGKSPLLYIVSLGVCIFLNFYFGFMLCTASVVVFLASLYVRGETIRGQVSKIIGKYLGASIFAGMLSAPMWLPALKAYSGGGRLNQTVLEEYRFSENMPFLQIFSKLFTGANSTNEIRDGMPNIFCGMLVIALVVLFFMNHSISLRKKKAAAVVLSFYLLTFYITFFTLLMHGGTHTNWLPYRYSFVFSFFLIGLAAEEFQYLDTVSLHDAKRCGMYILIAALLVFSTRYEFISGGSVLLDFVFLFLFYVALYFYKTKPEATPRRVFTLFLMLVVSCNLYANYVISIKKMQQPGWETDLGDYAEDILYKGAIIDAANKLESDFFRMEKDESDSGTVGADPMLYDYNGVSWGTPVLRAFVNVQLNRLGVNWFDMKHWYEGGIPAATDALLGLKYIESDRDLTAEKGYIQLIDTDHQDLYQSPYYLSVAILSDAAVQELTLGSNAFDNLNAVWRSMTGQERDIFHKHSGDIVFQLHNTIENLSVTSTDLNSDKNEDTNETPSGTYITGDLTAEQNGPLYRFDTGIPDSVNGSTVPSMKLCGVYKEGEAVNDTSSANTNFLTSEIFRDYCAHLSYAYADNDVLAEYAALLNARDITLNVVHENDLTGTFTAEPGQVILFTLPWDEGWTAYIDGEKVPINKTWDLFMSIDAPEGQHTYEMKFFPAWMDYGLYLCGAAFVGLVVLMIVWKRQKAVQSVVNQKTEIAEVID